MSNIIPKYQIGDSCFIARRTSKRERFECPICVGQKTVEVHYPNGEVWEVPCQTCDTGGFRNYSRGWIEEWVYNQIVVEQVYVEEIRLAEKGIEYTVKVWYEKEDEDGFHGGWNRQHAKEHKMFDTPEEAQAYMEAKTEEKAEEVYDELMRRKTHQNKSYASDAAYHRRKLADEFRSWQYHNTRLRAMNEQAKRYKKLYNLPEEGK